MDREEHFGVVVVGGGNAALSAAVSAADTGANVVMLEKAPEHLKGGNTYFTGDMRFGWDTVEDLIPLIGDMTETEVNGLREGARPYKQADFYDDIMRVTEGRSDPELLQLLVTEAYPTVHWMASMGHRWVPSYANPGASMAVALNGGGSQLSDRWFAIAESKGITIRYESQATEFLYGNNGNISGVRARTADGFVNYYAKAIVMGCGGFEASPSMRSSYLGPGWDLVKVRGVPFNTGDGLRMALDAGAWPYGHWSGCHATPQDLNRPAYSLRHTGSEFSRYAYPYSVMVNIHGKRFTDEGSDLRPYTYAKTGASIMAQPQGVAFQIFDRKSESLLRGYDRATGGKANSLPQLADMLGIDAPNFVRTIEEYNAAVGTGDFNPRRLDDKRTIGLDIPKSNWAQTIDEPPFHGYATVCGITFTFGGVRVNNNAQVLNTSTAPIPGLYACGEMVGGLFYYNYAGGAGLMQGATFGRIAGANAARVALGEPK